MLPMLPSSAVRVMPSPCTYEPAEAAVMLWSASSTTWPWLASMLEVVPALMVPTFRLLMAPLSTTSPSVAVALTMPLAATRTALPAVEPTVTEPMLPEAVRFRFAVLIRAVPLPCTMFWSAAVTPVPELPAVMLVVPVLLLMAPVRVTLLAELTVTAPVL